MLKELHIRNYAIIRSVDIAFDAKLNIITGETGAGKSILMGALGLILGDRADTRSLLHEADKCVIEGIFDISGYDLQPFFTRNELDHDPHCILRREIAPNGKTRAFINDTPVTLNQLKELGSQLVDIVSQHQTLALNDSDFQLAMVDAIADTRTLLDSYRALHAQFRQSEKKLAALQDEEAKARQDEDYLNFILNELNEAGPAPDEQEQLESRLETLSHAETIRQSAGSANAALGGDEQSVLDTLRGIRNNLGQAARHHSGLAALVSRIDSCMIELKDVSAELEHITEGTQADPQELERIESRLQLLFNLHKKHRVADNAGLLELKQQLEQKLLSLGSLTDDIDRTRQELERQREQLAGLAAELSKKRNKAIPGIENKVNELLLQVEMPEARISFRNEISQQFSPDGIDHVTLLFAANKGSAPQPISKVASGGELSRLMLCIKSLISDKIALPTIVFDEIDTGISGEAALKVSRVMKQHASAHQVIAITHLPQIAGKADNHLFVYKTTDRNTTQTYIRPLAPAERVEEIARMLHGANPSEKVLEAAKELMG